MPASQLSSTPRPISRPLMAGSLRDDPRQEVERAVEVRFRDFESAVRARSVNISSTGMFIRSREAQPAGSTLSFELSLDRAERLIRGVGEVVWMRRFELGVGRPAGMGIRFLDLDQESARTLETFMTERDARRHETADESAPRRATRIGGGRASGKPLAAMPAFARPLSGLTDSQQGRLYAFAGSASASPDRAWNGLIRSALSRAAGAARQALLGRKNGRLAR